MTQTTDIARLDIRERIATLVIDSPPVNALGQPVRQALLDAAQRLNTDETIDALVIRCEGRSFFAGADIREFGKPPRPPGLPEVVDALEASQKPVIAAMHGVALGGGLEVAMGCHFRIAARGTKLGLPEVKLGLMPGAGGTQRLPRLLGVKKALAMMMDGDPIDAAEAQTLGLVDELVDEASLPEAAVALAKKVLSERTPSRRSSERNEKLTDLDDEFFANYRAANARKIERVAAPKAILRAVQEGLRLDFQQAVALERTLFVELREGEQSKALRHMFFAEREASKVPGIDEKTPVLPVNSIGVIGAGTMGSGIAICFLSAGFPVTLVEQNEAALKRGVDTVRGTIEKNVQSGRATRAVADRALNALKPSLRYEDLSDADLIVEAAFETMEVKHEIFGKLAAIARRDAVLATNTSYLDVDAIAAVTSRPEQVLGMHFFSPANIMKLLEVVRAAKTSDTVLATALAVAKRIGKIAVVAGVCYGFIGNRMLAVRRREAERMILEGANLYEVDRVLEEFGFPMGPFRIGDLAGLDLGWSRASSTGSTLRECLCELGRLGQKSGAGFYDYDANRKPLRSPLVERLIRDFAKQHDIPQRSWTDAEILRRLLDPMIEEGNKILAEGKALRASDIDLVWVNGYGWPRWRGGPMYYAEQRAQQHG